MTMDIQSLLPEGILEINCAVTVTDADCKIIYMNGRARETFAAHGDLIGRNLMDCHNQRSIGIIRHLLATGGRNCYTIEKGGVHKLIFQSAWRKPDGSVGGLVEISIVTPDDMPHYVR